MFLEESREKIPFKNLVSRDVTSSVTHRERTFFKKRKVKKKVRELVRIVPLAHLLDANDANNDGATRPTDTWTRP